MKTVDINKLNEYKNKYNLNNRCKVVAVNPLTVTQCNEVKEMDRQRRTIYQY